MLEFKPRQSGPRASTMHRDERVWPPLYTGLLLSLNPWISSQNPTKSFISKASLSVTAAPNPKCAAHWATGNANRIVSQKDLTKLFLKEDQLKVLPLVSGIAKCQQYLFFSLTRNWKPQLGMWGYSWRWGRRWRQCVIGSHSSLVFTELVWIYASLLTV